MGVWVCMGSDVSEWVGEDVWMVMMVLGWVYYVNLGWI